MSIGSNLKTLRQQRNMSQVELARRAQIPQGQLSEYENDKIDTIPIEKLGRLADALRVSVAEIDERLLRIPGLTGPGVHNIYTNTGGTDNAGSNNTDSNGNQRVSPSHPLDYEYRKVSPSPLLNYQRTVSRPPSLDYQKRDSPSPSDENQRDPLSYEYQRVPPSSSDGNQNSCKSYPKWNQGFSQSPSLDYQRVYQLSSNESYRLAVIDLILGMDEIEPGLKIKICQKLKEL